MRYSFVKILFSIIFAVLLVIFLRRFVGFGRPVIQYELTDSSSPILEILHCEDGLKLPDGWDLSSVDITQGVDINNDNYADCRSRGTYAFDGQSYQENYFEIYFRVIYPTSRVIDQTTVLDDNIKSGEIFSPNFLKTGNQRYINCKKNQEVTSCILGVQYDYAVAFLNFWAGGDVSILHIENIINPILDKLDMSLISMKVQ